ncbi:unnamed protein product, partial [Ectocarpus sp. 4 AP-2014]
SSSGNSTGASTTIGTGTSTGLHKKAPETATASKGGGSGRHNKANVTGGVEKTDGNGGGIQGLPVAVGRDERKISWR